MENVHFCVLELPFEDLRPTHTVHIRLIGKPIVVFLLVIIELFSLGVTAEALRADITSKSAFLKRRCQFGPKFQIEGVVTNHPFSLSEN